MATSIPGLANPSDRTTEHWPCANCHAMVSEERCPFCHGIQKPVRRSRNEEMVQRAWIERVSPRTVSSPQTIISTQEPMQSVFPAVASDVDLTHEEVDAELDQNSKESVRPDLGECDSFGENRPNNPVAFLLESTAESPLPNAEFRKGDDSERKDKDIDNNAVESGPVEKKPRILFAM